MRTRFFVSVFAVLVLSLATPAFAHTTGSSWNVTSGPYTVDVGYDPITFTAGEYSRFDLLLWRGPANTGTPANFAQVWIRILKDGDTTLATGVWKQPIGPTTLLYQFELPGDYVLETSYRDADGNDIATSSFPITVQAGAGSGGVSGGVVFVAGLIVGAIAGAGLLAFSRRRA